MNKNPVADTLVCLVHDKKRENRQSVEKTKSWLLFPEYLRVQREQHNCVQRAKRHSVAAAFMQFMRRAIARSESYPKIKRVSAIYSDESIAEKPRREASLNLVVELE